MSNRHKQVQNTIMSVYSQINWEAEQTIRLNAEIYKLNYILVLYKES